MEHLGEGRVEAAHGAVWDASAFARVLKALGQSLAKSSHALGSSFGHGMHAIWGRHIFMAMRSWQVVSCFSASRKLLEMKTFFL